MPGGDHPARLAHRHLRHPRTLAGPRAAAVEEKYARWGQVKTTQSLAQVATAPGRPPAAQRVAAARRPVAQARVNGIQQPRPPRPVAHAREAAAVR